MLKICLVQLGVYLLWVSVGGLFGFEIDVFYYDVCVVFCFAMFGLLCYSDCVVLLRAAVRALVLGLHFVVHLFGFCRAC